MEIINVQPYSTNDKIKIVNKFLLNEILDKNKSIAQFKKSVFDRKFILSHCGYN
jgi:ATP-dependent Lon protease